MNPYVTKQVTYFSDGSVTTVTNDRDPYLDLPAVVAIESAPVPTDEMVAAPVAAEELAPAPYEEPAPAVTAE